MIRVAYLTGTRADFGLMKLILKAIEEEKNFQLLLFSTGVHLLKEFGQTLNEVKKEFKLTGIIKSTYEKDNRLAMNLFLGNCLLEISKSFNKYKPDFLLVLGDRAEQLAASIAATYLNIPILHLHGGEISGTVDNPVRQAISALANYHLVATPKSAKVLKTKGVNPSKIFIVGAPGIEEIKDLPKLPKKRQIIVLQHPAEDENQAGKQIETTLKAVVSFCLPTFIIYPNADAGGRQMIKIIKKFARSFSFLKIFPSLPRVEFLKLLSQSQVLVGNSSAGLIEAPSLKLPVVNIGERQRNRERTLNVIDVAYDLNQIKKAIKKALFSKSFKNNLKMIKNPYDQGKTSQKALKIIKTLVKNEKI